MIALLRAELRSIANLFVFPSGRTQIYALTVTLSMIALLATFIGRGTVASPPVLEALSSDSSGTSTRVLLGLLVIVAASLIGSLAFAQARRELFGPTSSLLLTAPVRHGTIIAATIVRLVLHGLPFALALGLPMLIPLILRLDLSWIVVPRFVASVMIASAPAVAAFLFVDVVLRRFLSGTIARMIMALFLTALGFIYFFAMIAGWGGGEGATSFLLSRLDEGTTRVAQLAGPDAGLAFGLVAIAVVLGGLTAALYRGAVERTIVDDQAAGRGMHVVASWPRGAVRSIMMREWLVLRQQPVHLLFYVFIFVPLAWTARAILLPPVILLPESLQWAWMLTLSSWWLVFTLLTCLLVASLASDDSRQLDLLRTVPASRRDLLAGRLFGLALPIGWTVVASAASATLFTDAGPGAIALHVAIALPMSVLAIGGIAAFGTFCTYVRGADGEETPSSVYLVGGVLGLTAILFGFMFLAPTIRSALQTWYAGDGPMADWPTTQVAALFFGVHWFVCVSLGWIGWRVGLRNYRRLLGPEA